MKTPTTRNGAPQPPIRAPRPPKPPTIPRPRDELAERRLDAAIEATRASRERAAAFLLAAGINPTDLLVTPKARALSGKPQINASKISWGIW